MNKLYRSLFIIDNFWFIKNPLDRIKLYFEQFDIILTSSVCQSSANICFESRDFAELIADESFPCELVIKSWLTLK